MQKYSTLKAITNDESGLDHDKQNTNTQHKDDLENKLDHQHKSEKDDLNSTLTQFQSSTMIINLVLATGPFTYPLGFCELGPVISSVILVLTCMISYLTATLMIEAMGTLDLYLIQKTENKTQTTMRNKLELNSLFELLLSKYVRLLFQVMMIFYFYGAICLKYIAGAQSFVEGVASIFYENSNEFHKAIGIDPYYLGLIVFGVFSLYFSFGNIEDSKVLQVVMIILRFIVTLTMCIGSVYYLEVSGVHESTVFDIKKQIEHLAKVFGNTTFIFVYHHSLTGIIYPVRPQIKLPQMILVSNVIGTIILMTESMLAYFAFSNLSNFCVYSESQPQIHYPCRVSGLYNQNFLGIPGIGQLVNFYPMLNICTVPVLTISLRNNVIKILNIERCCLSKGMWSVVLSIPVFAMVVITRDVQFVITYTGGICGAFILLAIPSSLVYSARTKFKHYNKITDFRSPHRHPGLMVVLIIWTILTLTSVFV